MAVIVLADNEIKDMKTKKPRKPFDLRGRLTGRGCHVVVCDVILITLLETP
jgi:hypothetical protein